jgi:hypothetical protein
MLACAAEFRNPPAATHENQRSPSNLPQVFTAKTLTPQRQAPQMTLMNADFLFPCDQR